MESKSVFRRKVLQGVYKPSTRGFIKTYPSVDRTILPNIINGFEKAQANPEMPSHEAAQLIADYKLPREAVPTQWLKNPEVWAALLNDMPMTAMIRNLANMSSCGLLVAGSSSTKYVVKRLGDTNQLKKARIHPVSLLIALRAYDTGVGRHNMWVTVPAISDALEDAFYESFKYVEPTGKTFLLGIDVSASMSSLIANTAISCCEGATAMALVTAHSEENYYIHAFADVFKKLNITKKTDLKSALRMTSCVNFGGTDCSLPMIHALQHKLPVDVFAVYTDNETWAGSMHPVQALKQYRDAMGIDAKLVVTAMTASSFTIADPNDPGMLDVVGFDSSTPNIISAFAGGAF
jgi:60 kDa SS-A/Ro ribonucleoprotein